ncbi:MAG: NADPH-dependent F420 reductase [Anaerolineales bacterium]|nr:NADPH-dependent F420 reductase [Anaerolineales bacterium]
MNKPVIAILGGTGKEGPGLALRWATAGYRIIIGSRQLEKAQETAASLNAQLGIDTISGLENADAARQADLSVLTVVQSAHRAALEGLVDALKGKILVDATARVEFRDPRPPTPPAAAEIAQQILGPEVRVVAAFQNVPAHALKKLDQPIASDVLVCAEDLAAAEQVIELARAGGMQAYYAGGLANAVVVEGLTALLISINKHRGIKTASIGITGV